MFDWQTGAGIVAGVVGLAGAAAFLASRSKGTSTAAAWDAQFSKTHESGLLGDTGIYLGIDRQSGGTLRYAEDRHIVTFGPNGSGKSRRLLQHNLMTLRDWSMLVIDPKGELAALTGKEREKYGKVVYLNPYGVRGIPDHGFNPILSLDPTKDEFIDDAMGLAEALVRTDQNDKEPHWAESAQDLVCSLVMYAALQDKPLLEKLDKRNMGYVRECLGKGIDDFREVIFAMQQDGVVKDWDELTIKASRFQDIKPDSRELSSIISNAVTQTRWIDSRAIKASMRNGVVDFAAMKKEPITVYLILPANRLATQSTWLRLVITCCLQKLIKDAVPGNIPVMLMLDEFAQLGHLPIIENTMALMRGYGIKLWSVFQDLSQLKAIYGPRWETFISNAGVLTSFAPQDTGTAGFISELTGLTARDNMNWSWSGKSPTFSGGVQGMPLMLPQAVRGLDVGDMLVFSHVAMGPTLAHAPFPK